MLRKSHVLILATLLAALLELSASIAAQQPVADKTFSRYLSCVFDDGLTVAETTRLPKGAEKFRMLKTLNGTRKVSRIDGYTVVFKNPNNGFVANVKVEQSNPQDYPQDKQIIVEDLKLQLSTAKAMDAADIKAATMKRFQTYGVDRNTLEIGQVIGTYVLFSDSDQKVITIYFLNQRPGKRKFQSIEEYRNLRDRFLTQYISCIN
jgi:hypothetical protein